MTALGPTVRTMPIGSIAVGVAFGSAFVAVAALPAVTQPVSIAMAGAVITASLAGFALEDSAAATLEPSPTTLRHRRAVRLFIAGNALLLALLLDTVLLQSRADGASGQLIHRAVALAAIATTSVAASAIAARYEIDRRGGAVGVMAASVMVLVLEPLSTRWPQGFPSVLFDAPSNGRWWWVLLAAAAVVAWCSRDPA
jgi:hypothetical protein